MRYIVLCLWLRGRESRSPSFLLIFNFPLILGIVRNNSSVRKFHCFEASEPCMPLPASLYGGILADWQYECLPVQSSDISGRSAARQRACFGSKKSRVRIPAPRLGFNIEAWREVFSMLFLFNAKITVVLFKFIFNYHLLTDFAGLAFYSADYSLIQTI